MGVFFSQQFKHMRMSETANVEINNPIYMRDYDEDDPTDAAFSFEADKVRYQVVCQVEPQSLDMKQGSTGTVYYPVMCG